MTSSQQYKGDKLFIVLNYYVEGKRKQKWVKTNLTKGDKKSMKNTEERHILTYYENNMHLLYSDKMTVEALMELWISKKKNDVKESTLYGYQTTIKKHIYTYFKDQHVQDIEKYHIQDFLDSKKETLNSGTIKKLKIYLQEAFDLAIDRKIIVSNPCYKTKIKKKERLVLEHFSESDIDKILEISKGHRLESLIHLCALYGLRRSEALGLKWSNVDLKNGVIRIAETFIKCKGKAVNAVCTKNLPSTRDIPLRERSIQYLTFLKEQQEEFAKEFGETYQKNDFVCKYADGKLFNIDETTRSFKRLLKRNGMKELGLHSLRHSFAYIAIYEKGIDSVGIRDIMGHSDLNTTTYYVKDPSISEKRKTILKLDGKAC